MTGNNQKDRKGPLISVVIPLYNREKEIAASLQSVRRQTYQNIEVIVVDDASSDHSADIVDQIAEADSRVRPCVRLSQNAGACHARNVGASLARGKYIAFEDSDDIWLPHKLNHQLHYLRKGNYDLVFCRLKRITQATGKYVYWPDHPYSDRRDALRQILFASPTGTQCLFMKKEFFDQIRFDENMKRLQDWDFMIRAAQKGRIGYLKETQVLSYLLGTSITNSHTFSESYQAIYDKYQDLILPDPVMHARFEERMGDGYFRRNPDQAMAYYKSSLSIHPTARTAGKLLLAQTWKSAGRLRGAKGK